MEQPVQPHNDTNDETAFLKRWEQWWHTLSPEQKRQWLAQHRWQRDMLRFEN